MILALPVMKLKLHEALEKGQETGTERMRILIKKHNAMLDEIHFREKQLDRLNYLRYEIQKKNSSRD